MTAPLSTEELERMVRAVVQRLTELEDRERERDRQLSALQVWASESERPPAQTGTELSELRARVELLVRQQKGEQGPPGKQGPPGLDGRQGPPGKDGLTVIREVKISG